MSVPRDPLHDDASARVGHERRRHPRATIDCPITIELEDGPVEARLRDVSHAGVCFFLDRRIPEMTVLGLRLDLPAAKGARAARVQGSGVVVRCMAIGPHVDHYEIALFLNHMSESDREVLDAYIGALQPR